MSKRYLLLLSFVTLLFVFLYLMLSYYSRLATDDYYFIWDVRTNGIMRSLHTQYMQWSGRFSAGFIADTIYYYLNTNQPCYFFYPLVSLIMIVCGSYYAILMIFIHFQLNLTRSQKWIAAFLFTSTLFFLSVDIGESWFWYCSLSCYLWSIIAFIWAVSFLFDKRYLYLSTIGAIICFVYIGGASEFNSVIFGIFITFYLIFKYKQTKNFRSFINDKVTKKIIVGYIALGISFIVLMMAPGNYLRDGLFPEHHFFYSFYIVAKSVIKFSIFYFPLKIPFLIAFAAPFSIFGKIAQSQTANLFSTHFKPFFIRSTLYLAIIIFIFFLLVAYIMVETGPPRVWFLLSFLLAVYFTILFFYAGYCNIFSTKQLRAIKTISIIAGIAFLLSCIFYQHHIAEKYVSGYDNRILMIKDLNKKLKKDTLITLPPLPPCGMLYSAEIKPDTNHFTNKELRIGYNLKFHVAVENKEP